MATQTGMKDFLLPDLGEGLTEGEVVSWMVAEGDVVEVDQYVAEIETAKAVVEVPSPFGGTVVKLHGQPGDEIMVGAPLITIDVGGGEADEPAAPAPSADSASDEADSGAGDASSDVGDASSDVAAADGASGNVLVGYGTSGGGGSKRRRVASEQQAGGESAKVQREGRPMAKPPVRKLAKDLGVDLDYVAGSGPDGIITRADVEAAGADGPPVSSDGVLVTDDEGHVLPSAPPNTGAPAPAAVTPVTIPASPEGGLAQERVKLNQMRRAISAQMSRSRSDIPEAVTWVEADATPLWEFRKELNAAQAALPEGGVKVSALAIVMRMSIAALRRFPTVNSSLDTTTEEMVLHRQVNLGFAAQTDRGLVVPVIKNAQDLSIIEFAEALNRIAGTARAGKLSPADMAGGTFTVSNYGAFGVDGGDMVINHPEAAILGTGRIVDKPWVVNGKVKVRKVITYSIAFDHRLIDGGEGAGFIRFLADMTENPALLTASL